MISSQLVHESLGFLAGWSSRHRKTAVFGWLALVAALFVAAHALGTKTVPTYDPGQAGQAQRALHQAAPGNCVRSRRRRVVLIQALRARAARSPRDAAMRQAARQLVAALGRPAEVRRWTSGSPLTLAAGTGAAGTLVSADGQQRPGHVQRARQRAATQDQAVAADQRAVARRAGPRPRGLLVAETGRRQHRPGDRQLAATSARPKRPRSRSRWWSCCWRSSAPLVAAGMPGPARGRPR